MHIRQFERFPSLPVLADQVTRGDITPTQLINLCIARIDGLDDTLRAWVHVDKAGAIESARDLDSQAPRTPLHGVPFGVKDVIDAKGMPTRFGSSGEVGRLADNDADCVSMLRRAGAVPLGKTTTSEYASLSPTATRNPYNVVHTPGGSSSGSAAAVAAGMVPFAIGTQTLGSVIRPASYCGVFGMKPSYGLVPVGGALSASQRLDTIGFFASRAEDLDVVFSAVTAVSNSDSPPGEGRIADRHYLLAKTPWWGIAEAPSREAFRKVQSALKDNALSHDAIELPDQLYAVPELQGRVAQFEMTRSVFSRYLSHGHLFTRPLREKVAEGIAMRESDYWDALQKLNALSMSVQPIFDRGTILVTPATTGVAPKGLDSTGDSTFNRPWSIFGNPVVSVPVARDRETGLSLSVQLVGKLGGDVDVIRAAREISDIVRVDE